MRVFGFAGYSGSGKTTLIKQLVSEFVAQGLRVSSIKFAHHDVDVDRPGKDSWQLREAGSDEVLLVSGKRWVLFHDAGPQADLAYLFSRLAPCDLVLVEGCREQPLPKLELWRNGIQGKLRWPDDPHVLGLVGPTLVAAELPQFRPGQLVEIAAFVGQNARKVDLCC